MKAYVIGNAALDETLAIDRFVQPDASVFGRPLSRDLGGKGTNQAIALARTGLPCQLFAAVGQDARGQEIATRLQAEPVMAELITQDGVSTDASTILMAATGENAIITTRDAAEAFTPDQARAALADAQAGDLLVMQGNLSGQTTLAALQEAKARGLTTAFNPSPLQDYFAQLWPHVDIAYVNEGEAEALGGVAALQAQGVAQVVLTLGGAGARLITARQDLHVPASPCTVVDTTGAGDCFMAVSLGSAALRGTDLDARALAHGAAAAAHTVARAGTVSAFPSMAEMRALLAS
ncbi:ribokinase [Rhodobacter sp. TJ_12]|uniref:PfkB family carbohydrate kinase n=1 Tax=Rhodobacter sp. TJ_12 TaxID=2029399 RepID=UPI001CBF95B3|nr:PfkB family carbohydrate kinase [Rhodobacter sp. TJ_12]MBZ4021932.1 ribokinase [Rhodobacter sp. TJ_12]